jgi:hypothetical protein
MGDFRQRLKVERLIELAVDMIENLRMRLSYTERLSRDSIRRLTNKLTGTTTDGP